jgi:hypothetical protein
MFLPQVRFRLWLLDSLYDAHRPVIGGNLSRSHRVFANVRFGLPAQPVDATQALNLSAGVSNCKVSRGRSLS